MRRTKRTLAVVAVAAVAVAGAIGTYALVAERSRPVAVQLDPEAPDTVGSQAVVAPTAVPAPRPANPATAGAAPGDVVDVDPGTPTDGSLVYELADGRFALVDPEQPLPEAVTQDVSDVLGVELAAADGDLGRTALALDQVATRVSATTGYLPVIVYPVQDAIADPDTRSMVDGWVHWGRTGDVLHESAPYPTQQEAAEAAAQWVAEQDGNYQIVTVTR